MNTNKFEFSLENPYNYLKDYENQIIDYKDFCELIQEPIKDGSERRNQLKIISNYIDLDLKYGKIKINKVLSSKELILLKHKAKFSEYIEDLLVLYLANDNSHKVTLTYREMAEYFYMINESYYDAKYNKTEYINEFKLPISLNYTKYDLVNNVYKDIGLFFTVTDKLIKEIINNSLKSLMQKGLIIARDNFKIYKQLYNPVTKKYYTKTYICTKEQRQEFLDIRKKIMERYGLKKLQDIVYMKYEIREKYFNDLSKEMKKSDILYNCNRYANAWDIEYGEKAIEHEYKRIQAQNKKLVNNNMKYKLLTTSELKCINTALKEQFVNKFI